MTEQPFQAFRMNRVVVVIDSRTKEAVGHPFSTQEGGDAEAARLNLQVWRESKPESALSEPLVFEDAGDLEDRIVGIVDRMYGPENLDLERLAA